jgi:hypothetical protein
LPDFDSHGGYASIFSTGSTSIELAPASLKLLERLQNTFSRHTACTATLSSRPSSRE